MEEIEMPLGIDTLELAQIIASQLDGDYDDERGVFFAASATRAETGRIVLAIDVYDDEENETRSFRFLGGEVTA